jgi:hypothetical protein
MAIYAMLGMAVVAAIFAAGATWIVRSVSFKPMKPRYEYKTDEAGNEYVQDNSMKSKDEHDEKA